jgi:hypothetical protein
MTPISLPVSGRLLVGLGFLLCLLGIGLGIAQFSRSLLFVPWYVPAMSTIGALLVLLAFTQRRTIGGGVALVLTLALAAFEWFALGIALKTPEYVGPAKAGSPMPSFRTVFADGRPFTDRDLATGQTTVLTFFRGRW